MVNDVGFVISEEEDLPLGPDTRLDHSGLLCGRSFITAKRDGKTSDIAIKRGWRVPHSLVFSKGITFFLISYYNKSKYCLKVAKNLPDTLPQFTF